MKKFVFLLISFAFLASGGVLMASERSSYIITIGSGLDDLFILQGFYQVEGPYQEYDEIWKSPCRWAVKGAELKIPVFPGVANTIELKTRIHKTEGQNLRLFINGKLVGALPFSDNYLYTYQVPADVLGDSGWAIARFEAEHSLVVQGDIRDLNMVFGAVKISADAPRRNYVAEVLAESGMVPKNLSADSLPEVWSFRTDENNIGDTYAPKRFNDARYDTSGWRTVGIDYSPQLRQGEAAWYSAWMLVEDVEGFRKSLKLPGEEFEKSGSRKIWVNGHEVRPDTGKAAVSAVAEHLVEGANLLTVKVMQGPISSVKGDSIIKYPKMTGSWEKDKVFLKLAEVELAPEATDAASLTLTLLAPDGAELNKVKKQTTSLGDGRKGCHLNLKWQLTRFGANSLVVIDDRGRKQSIPVHYLGLHLFHWGWYSAQEGTGWNGYNPTSNVFIDELFERLKEWDQPHHSITWGGAIIAPGTGFHRTEKVNYIDKFRQAFKDGSLDFVGAPFPPRNICTDFGESLLRSMRISKELYNSQFGVDPRRFISHDSTMTPLLPQIMHLCGYDTYTVAENWWGQGRAILNSRDSYFANEEGTKVRILDSWYHGIPPTVAARRAVEIGKPAVLCNEEFACLDRTVFLEQSHLDTLASEGIFLKRVSLDEYQKITESYSRKLTYTGDDALCYKGWTGGGQGEVEYEKANRMLETRLVALENILALAGLSGIQVDRKQVDDWWDKSLRLHECHNHWGNGIPDQTAHMWNYWRQALESMETACKMLTDGDAAKVTVFNPLGFERSGLVRMPEGFDANFIASEDGQVYPLQLEPGTPQEPSARKIAMIHGLPSLGFVTFKPARSVNAQAVTCRQIDEGFVLDNGIIRAVVRNDGSLGHISDARTGEKLVGAANVLHFARAQDKSGPVQISTRNMPLNPECYQSPEWVDAAWGEGPVMAHCTVQLKLPDYPGLKLAVMYSLASGERKVDIKTSMSFDNPTVIHVKGAPSPHEGTYIPGIFASFPFDENGQPRADMAYCYTDNVLSSTNHETFLAWPFRNGTFNTLSFAGPSSGEYAVLGRGMHDWFVIRCPEPFLGLSFGTAPAGMEYNGSYVHEYALLVPDKGQREKAGEIAYKEASAFYVDPVAVNGHVSGDLLNFLEGLQDDSVTVVEPTVRETGRYSFVSASDAIIPGVELRDGKLKFRVVNLNNRKVTATLAAMPGLAKADVLPSGKLLGNKLQLGPKALREVVIPVK